MNKRSKLIILVLIVLMQACSGGSDKGIFNQPTWVVVDSTNDRFFVLEQLRQIFAFTASDRSRLGDQPVVNKKRLIDIYDILPLAPLQSAVYANGSDSRLFITGAMANDDGEHVLNRVLVLDFDGTTFTEASFSPLVLSDGDDATDETDNVPGGLLVDQASGRLYLTDSTAGLLYILNAADGSVVNAPLVIAGIPNKMSLTGNSLFVANSSTVGAEQVVTVVNTTDFTTATFDLDAAISDISVSEVGGSFVVLAQNTVDNQVLIRTVSADLTTVAEIGSATSAAVSGALVSGSGLTGIVGGLLLTTDASGNLFGYVPQSDGNIELLSFASDVSSFTASELATVTELIKSPQAYENGTGDGLIVYMVAQSSGDLIFTDVGSTEVGARF
ncbi:MAG: hypothetical protein ACD_73C00720G0006 [uncultured bacterium]|nr:MAG: hypothetical protein ACD_73C00720G0006 [uncultured bacterium]